MASLRLKSMVCLSPGDIRSDLRVFCNQNSIILKEVNVGHNQEPFLIMDSAAVEEVITYMSLPEHQPCLVFCNNGKQRTNAVIGCFRKAVQSWSLTSIFNELEVVLHN